MVLFGGAADGRGGYTCVVPEDVNSGFFGFEGFYGRSDYLEVVELKEEKFEFTGRRRIAHRSFDRFDTLTSLGFGVASYVDLATCFI